jgi:glutamyl-Q tRNA(Asp) synthetase
MMYRGRFAPSPTGPLHAGSLAAALASWLDARAHRGAWLIRVEDVDAARCKAVWGEEILQQLAAHGLLSDEPVLWQSARSAAYTAALAQLQGQGLIYACNCSRKKISDYWQAQGVDKARHGDLVYPGFCRDLALPMADGVALRLDVGKAFTLFSRHSCESRSPPAESPMRSLQSTGASGVDASLRWHDDSWIPACAGMTESGDLSWHDRHLGTQSQNIAAEVGDFVLRRTDTCFSYQVAVVVDDAAQGISHVVRGQDLLDNTPRQILLQSALNLPTPQYLHTPLVLAADGQKLSKQNGAAALNSSSPAQCLANLQAAVMALGLPAPGFAPDLPAADYLHCLLPLWAQSEFFRVF